MLPTLYMCSSLGILRIYSIYDLTIDFWSSKPTHAPSNTEPGSKCLSCQPLVGTYTNIPSLFLWERVKNSRKLIENMSSCTKPSIPSCQPHALLHSPCKMTNVAGFTLALSNRNPNNYSADAQRTRILVTWFGKATLTICRLETCHVWPRSHKPGAKHTSSHPSLWVSL